MACGLCGCGVCEVGLWQHFRLSAATGGQNTPSCGVFMRCSLATERSPSRRAEEPDGTLDWVVWGLVGMLLWYSRVHAPPPPSRFDCSSQRAAQLRQNGSNERMGLFLLTQRRSSSLWQRRVVSPFDDWLLTWAYLPELNTLQLALRVCLGSEHAGNICLAPVYCVCMLLDRQSSTVRGQFRLTWAIVDLLYTVP